METVKDRFSGVPLGVILAVVINLILFMGLPLLTQIQRTFQEHDMSSSILLTQHKPPKPPDPERERRLKEKKPKKLKKEEQKKLQKAKPKIDIPKFDFALGGDLTGGLAISASPRDLRPSMLRTAFTLSEVDQPPRPIRQIDPLYPFAAKRKGIQGSVTMRFIVTKDGRVIDPTVVKAEPPGVFDNSALKAIVRWRFKPAMKDGQSVDVIIIAPLKFELIK